MREESGASVVTWGVIIVITCLILYVFQRVVWLVVPGLLTLVGYYCLQPLVRWLVRSGLKPRTAVRVVTGFLFLVAVVGAFLVLSLAATRATEWKAAANKYVRGGLTFVVKTERVLSEQMPSWERSLPAPRGPAAPEKALKPDTGKVGEADAEKEVDELLKKAQGFLSEHLGGLALQMLCWLPSVLLVPYLTYFMLLDGNLFKRSLIHGVPNAFFEKTLLLVDRVDRSLQGFLVGVVKLTFLDTVCLGLGLSLLGIHYPFLLGLIAAMLAWVPYVGSVAGCVMVTLVAATDYGGEHWAVYGCIALFIGVRLLDDFVFLPMTVGRSLRFHPVLSVLMLFVGAAVAGPTGLLFVLPVLGVVAVITQTLGQILTDERLRARYRHARQLKRALAQAGQA